MDKHQLSLSELQLQELTWREREILGLLAERLSDKEISELLHLALTTIKWYNRQIYSKLGVANRKQAVMKASDLQGLETPEKLDLEDKAKLNNNIPSQLSSFVGRKKEVAELVELLNTSRLIVLTGTGGSGKTRLAMEVAQKVIDSYRDGVWQVELADINDPTTVPIEIANVLRANTQNDITHIDRLTRYLAKKHLLLILDNFEHLTEEAAILGELLTSAPNLTILVTSRSRLGIYGEQEFSLSALKLPDLGQRESSESLLAYEAIDLFIKRASAAQFGLVLEKDDIDAIAKICVLLDGLPLAIELAAPLVKIYGFNSLAQRLEEDLGALPEGPHNIPERQRTLSATMDWSYQLLEEDDKTLFDRLSIFRGGGTLDAIESICTDGLSSKGIDRLFSLVQNNLVIPIETVDGELHFAMLATIKKYGQKRLLSRSDVGIINRKFAAYYADLAELSLSEIRGPNNSYWFKRLEVENQNFRSALDWSLYGNEPEYGFRMVGPLSYYWYYKGTSRENSNWIELALEKSSSAAPRTRAHVLLTAGMVAHNLNDHFGSQELLSKAIEIFNRLGDELFLGFVMLHLSLASHWSSQKPEEVLSMAHEGLEIFRKYDNKAYMAMAYDILGEIAHLQGDDNAAKKHFLDSLDLSKGTGEILREATLHANLGVIAFNQKNYKTAHQRNKVALTLSADIPSPYLKAYHLVLIAGPIAALGFPMRAAKIFGAAAAEMDQIGDVPMSAEQTEVDKYTNFTQKALGENAFHQAWKEGQRMMIQEAIAYALSDENDTD